MYLESYTSKLWNPWWLNPSLSHAISFEHFCDNKTYRWEGVLRKPTRYWKLSKSQSILHLNLSSFIQWEVSWRKKILNTLACLIIGSGLNFLFRQISPPISVYNNYILQKFDLKRSTPYHEFRKLSPISTC